MLLVQVPSEQRAADAARYRPERATTHGIADQGAADAAGNRTDCTIAAATMAAIASAMAVIDPMVVVIGRTLRERRRRRDR